LQGDGQIVWTAKLKIELIAKRQAYRVIKQLHKLANNAFKVKAMPTALQ